MEEVLQRWHISLEQSLAMQRLGIDEEQWLSLSCEFEQHFSGAAGNERSLRQYHQHLGHHRKTSLSKCKRLLNSA